MVCLTSYILLSFGALAQGYLLHTGGCDGVECRPGRECEPVPGDHPRCVCVAKCPDHWKPVCGSDGSSYDNHCELHRAACISGSPVSPIHAGFCRNDREKVIGREEVLDKSFRWNETQDIEDAAVLPTACFENDRNRLREFIMDWFKLNSKKQTWYSHGMSYNEELWGHFYSMDKDGDKFLDSGEMLDYLNRNKTNGRSNPLRQLCLDALVEEGDTNWDWRLSFQEYKEILSESFVPSAKLCSLNGRMYEDGAETMVDCNGCVCACGKWICTSKRCPESHKNMYNSVSEQIEIEDSDDDDDYDSEEDRFDDEYPEDDPDVQDIKWF